MLGALHTVFRFFLNSLKAFGEFLMIFFLGVLNAIVLLLPWLIRLTSVVTWIVGTYLAGEAVNSLYSPISSPISASALWSVPAILAAIIPVWLHAHRQLPYIWGAFFLHGVLCWTFANAVSWLTANWKYFDLFFPILPVVLVITLTLFQLIRLRLLITFRQEALVEIQKEVMPSTQISK